MGEYSYKPDRVSTGRAGLIKHQPLSYHTIKLYTKDIDLANSHRAMADKASKLGLDRVQGTISKQVPNPGNPVAFGKESKSVSKDPKVDDWMLDDDDDPDELSMVHRQMNMFHHKRARAYNAAGLRHAERCMCGNEGADLSLTESQGTTDSSVMLPKESSNLLEGLPPNKCTALEAMNFHKKMHTEALGEMLNYNDIRSNIDKYIDAEPDPEKKKAFAEAKDACEIQHNLYNRISELHSMEVAGYTDYLKRKADSSFGQDEPDVIQPSYPHVGGIFSPAYMNV